MTIVTRRQSDNQADAEYDLRRAGVLLAEMMVEFADKLMDADTDRDMDAFRRLSTQPGANKPFDAIIGQYREVCACYKESAK
jgi:hypothetical protein